MSGTLMPQEMYRDMLGFPENNTELREYASPFPAEKRLNVVCDTITTRYAKRSEENYVRIASEIAKVVEEVPGNSAVFFPSYGVMRAVLSYLEISKPLFIQKERSTPAEMKLLLDSFRAKSAFGALLCAVAGGSAAEGVDYPGRDLLAAIIVGVPLKEWGIETKALVAYYEYKFGAGWDYGYLYPAMARAVQAGGRVIRNESDRGVVVFLDERFKQRNYSCCFPRDMSITLTRDAAYCVNDFFSPRT
jgi:DNA excision repair protein ERCC-2